MTAQQLSVMLSGLGDNEVAIKLDIPNVGCSAYTNITGIEVGFDWDTGKIFLTTDSKLIDKNMVL